MLAVTVVRLEARAILTTLLHAAAIYRFERLAATRSVLLATASSQDLRLTLEVIVEQAAARLKADAADILVLDENRTELTVASSKGFQSA